MKWFKRSKRYEAAPFVDRAISWSFIVGLIKHGGMSGRDIGRLIERNDEVDPGWRRKIPDV